MNKEALLGSFSYLPEGRLLRKSNGRIAGTSDSRGYRQIRFEGVLQLEHRMIYLMHHGYLPEFIDHRNGNRQDNRIENLRPATRSQNIANSKRKTTNKSGVKGVHWHKQHKKWYANIKVAGKSKFLGLFKDIDQAANARKKAEEELLGEYRRVSA